MKKLYVVLFVVLLIASCKDNPAKPEPEPEPKPEYPFTNQTWQVESGDLATYIGVKGKLKSGSTQDSSGIDTTFIDQPLKYSLEIKEGFTSGFYAFKFVDSTVTRFNAETDSIGFPRPDSLFGYRYQSMHVSYKDEYSVVELNYPFDCSKTYEEEDFAYINYKSYSDTTKIVRVYSINVKGALETIHHIRCE